MNADAVSQGTGPILRPRSADGWGLGGALALGVHLMLVAALALGVRWKMTPPETVEAEVWAEIPRAAAPEAPPPPPPVEVPPKAETPPVETPTEPVKAAEPEPPVPQPIPDLVIEKKPKKEPKKRKHREPVEVFEIDPPKPVKKVDKTPEKTPPKKAEPVKPESKKPAPAAKTEPSKTTSASQSGKPGSQQNPALKGIMAQLEASLGAANRSAGPSAAYAGRIVARVKPNIVFTDSLSGDPRAVVEVHCSPDGRIIARKVIESSGVPAWDDAVLRAIDKTEVLPKNEQGEVPISMQLGFRYKDF